MSLISTQIKEYLQTQSWIRRMFEAATELRAKYGEENVFDFSLGNPDLPPPAEVGDALSSLVKDINKPLSIGYCANAGRPAVRAAVAAKVSEEQQIPLAANHIVMTAGAAGALNVLFRTILQSGEEVVCHAPYFVEYGFYAGNYGAFLKTVMSKDQTFRVDVDQLQRAINPNTRALLINSPNNPTGVVYTREEIAAIAQLLRDKSAEYGRPILLISDEPYRFLTFDNIQAPPLLPAYEYSVVVSSFSKSLSLAGERIGYIAVNPLMDGVDLLLNGIILANRILGFVNAPVIGQEIIRKSLQSNVDISIYERRRRAMASLLDDMGFEYSMPQGAFYFFPRVPQGYTDTEFIDLLMTENIIAVPGSGFGCPGYFRLTYCMDTDIINNSRPAWERLKQKIQQA
ncbi:MAG: pyridoxal phosphate-dependent aminotransferase [Calditrichaeota bacterium]|nr:MAG: pyridoxal phosphate-dependent aminotransferase [Calditrichota bacterium]